MNVVALVNELGRHLDNDVWISKHYICNDSAWYEITKKKGIEK